MELGARVCLPRQPRCLVCPLHERCAARLQGRVAEFPPAKKKRQPLEVSWEVGLVTNAGRILLVQSEFQPFLQDSWMCPWGETLEQLQERANVAGLRPVGTTKQGVTFRNLTLNVHHGQTDTLPTQWKRQAWFRPEEWKGLPLSSLTRKVLAFYSKASLG